jgi:hypothetical protein
LGLVSTPVSAQVSMAFSMIISSSVGGRAAHRPRRV